MVKTSHFGIGNKPINRYLMTMTVTLALNRQCNRRAHIISAHDNGTELLDDNDNENNIDGLLKMSNNDNVCDDGSATFCRVGRSC